MLIRAITNSERSCFGCQKKWWFRYIEGLTVFEAPAPLRQGTLWHHVLAAIYRTFLAAIAAPAQAMPFLLAHQVINPWIEQKAHEAGLLYPGNEPAVAAMRAAKQQEDLELANLVGIMATGYIRHWSHADAKQLKVIAVEPQVARWIPHPTKPGRFLEDYVTIKGKRHRRRWCYAGALDLIVQDLATGLFWFMEHKSTKAADLNVYMRKLHWDPQIRGYAWALRNPIPELSEIKEPINVAGVLYNVARKKEPSKPKTLAKCAKCGHPESKHGPAGCSGSQSCGCLGFRPVGMSKAACDTTREVYLATLLEHGFDPGDYEDVLASLPGWDAFFGRETYPITPGDLADFEADMVAAAMQMRDAEKAAVHPRQTQICLGGVSPMGCEYSDICIADGNMARAGYRVQPIRHLELHGDLAEPYMAQARGLTLAADGAPGRHPDRLGEVVLDPGALGAEMEIAAHIADHAGLEVGREIFADPADPPNSELESDDDPWSDLIAP